MAKITAREGFRGGLLGLALGDAPFEDGIIERGTCRCICAATGTRLRRTDDTQMSLDRAESSIAMGGLDADDLAQRFANSYRWNRGYGPGAVKLLLPIRRGADWRTAIRSVFPDGSFGNGAAMLSPIVGLFHCKRPIALLDAAEEAASITHAHPLGVEGAVIIAMATAAATDTESPVEFLQWSLGGLTLSPLFLASPPRQHG
jgi:poly(ADP-ribose) glycohydrolase ARH3